VTTYETFLAFLTSADVTTPASSAISVKSLIGVSEIARPPILLAIGSRIAQIA
jgi:hypothetical protein